MKTEIKKEYIEKATNAKSGRQLMFYTLQMMGFTEVQIKALLKYDYEGICEMILKGLHKELLSTPKMKRKKLLQELGFTEWEIKETLKYDYEEVCEVILKGMHNSLQSTRFA